MTDTCHDVAAKFVYTLTDGKRKYLERADFQDMIQVQ